MSLMYTTFFPDILPCVSITKLDISLRWYARFALIFVVRSRIQVTLVNDTTRLLASGIGPFLQPHNFHAHKHCPHQDTLGAIKIEAYRAVIQHVPIRIPLPSETPNPNHHGQQPPLPRPPNLVPPL